MPEEVKKRPAADNTAPERRIERQIATAGPKDARATGNLKAEQPIRDEVPDDATLVRGYYKWTDNDGNFHKVPIDGTTAIREPAHEQNELTVEDRDRLYQTIALKTPRRDAAKAEKIHERNVRNDEVHDALQGASPVEPIAAEEGEIDDGEDFVKDPEVTVGTPAAEVRGEKR
jgi:hypothetical protein